MKRKTPKTKQTRSGWQGIALADLKNFDSLCTSGYVRLSDNPEVQAGAGIIAELIGSMTIYLMGNTDNGDIRIKNELSRKVDINPYKYGTRKTWMETIIMNLLIHGSGNSVVIPQTVNGLLDDLPPADPEQVQFFPDGNGYYITYRGKRYDPEEILHFILNPDPHFPWRGNGIKTQLLPLANNLKQAAATEKGFLESKWKPSIIIKVDSLTEEFSSKTGRKKLMEEYIETNEAGEPWLIPAEQFSVEQVRPLSLADLAIKDTIELDKKTVASILGVPAFVLGVGTFSEKEWNNFIRTKIGGLVTGIAQEMTKKLIISPNWYWMFNVASLYAYDIQTTANVFSNLYTRGIVTGNEVRDRLSMSPKEGLDELVILENYIPAGMIGDQKKLIQEGEDE